MADEEQYQYGLAQQRYQEEQAALAEQEETSNQNRMGWGIFIVGLILSLIADVAELFTLGTLGWFVGAAIDLILLAMFGFSKAGRSQWKKWIWGPIIETIPVLSAVPLFRAAFLTWSFIASRSKTLQTVTGVASMGLSQKKI